MELHDRVTTAQSEVNDESNMMWYEKGNTDALYPETQLS